jgi:hypothetical protein
MKHSIAMLNKFWNFSIKKTYFNPKEERQTASQLRFKQIQYNVKRIKCFAPFWKTGAF